MRHSRGWRENRQTRARAAVFDLAHSLVDGAKYGAGLFRQQRPKEIV
jgi:hypothetical protein